MHINEVNKTFQDKFDQLLLVKHKAEVYLCTNVTGNYFDKVCSFLLQIILLFISYSSVSQRTTAHQVIPFCSGYSLANRKDQRRTYI